jgi:hypothetical protein
MIRNCLPECECRTKSINKEEDETSQRDLDIATIVGKQAIRCLTLRREADIQKLEANKRNKLKAKGISQGNDLHGQGPG